MRTVTAQMNAAAGEPGGYHPLVEISINNPRRVFTEWDDNSDYVFTPTDPAGILAEPFPETCLWSTSLFNSVTLLTAKDGTLVAMVYGDATKRTVRQGATALQSIDGCRAGMVNGFLFYLASDGNLKRATVDMNNLATQENMVTAQENVAAYDETGGSVIALSSTQVCVFYVDEGGIRFAYYAWTGSSWAEYRSPGRLFSPENSFTSPYETVPSAAVQFNNAIWFYISDIYRGNVYATSLDLENYDWRDIHEAVQSDLSDTRVVNAMTANNHVHLSVQFGRKEEWNTNETYNLVLHSHTGRYFSMHRFTYHSRLGNRVHLTPTFTATLGMFSSLNRRAFINFGPGQPTMSNNGISLTIPGSDIIQVHNENNDQTMLIIADRDNNYSSFYTDYFQKGARVTLRMGYKTTNGDERVQYSILRISSVEKDHIDPKSPLTLSCSAEATFFLQDLSSPFYGEIIGRTSKYDSCENLSNLYVAPNSGIGMNNVTVDFWNAQEFDNDEDPTVTPIQIVVNGGPDKTDGPANHKYGFRTDKISINARLKGNPKVLSGGTFNVKLYGWCASANIGTPNDTVSCYANIKNADTGIETLVQGTLTSTHDRFPKNFNGISAGSYPITWDITAAEDDEVVWLGFIFEQSTGATTFVPECAELGNVSAVDINSIANTPWSKVVSEVEQALSELEVPAVGEPFIMFSSQPYNPFNFQVIADIYVTGTGGGDGTTEFGLVGLAEDALNMVFCRYVIQTGDWQIVRLRGGAETVLATTNSPLADLDTKLMFEHRDGEFAVYAAATETWGTPILTYSWKATDGAICTHAYNWHVGVRAGVLPLKFRIAGFDISDGDGIPFMGNFPTAIMADLAAAGKVTIDGTVYKYTGKTQSERPVGPYQGRSTFDWSTAPAHDNGNGTFSGIAHDMRWYAPEKTRYSKANYLLAAQNGHTWLIKETEFDPWTRTGGSIVQLRNRSRHFSDSAHGNYIGSSHRVCISPGLTGISLKEGEAGLHSYGTWCYSHIEHTIRMRTFRASDGHHDSTVKDMIARAVEVAGSKAAFPGDLTWTTLALSANAEQQLI